MTCEMKIIARVRSDFPSKFGIPRQSGLVNELVSHIVFEPAYRNPDALRGIEGFSYLWLIWQFSECVRETWSPTVRPPRLGGNTRVGVFATRSPFRPNAIGLSSVRLEKVEIHPEYAAVLVVRGADLMDGTPILDIKPYLAYTDSHPQACDGFAYEPGMGTAQVVFPPELLDMVPTARREALLGVLGQDPRPGYQHAPGRVYGVAFAGMNVKFTVEGAVLRVCAVEPLE